MKQALKVILTSSEKEKSLSSHTPMFVDNVGRMEKTFKNVDRKMRGEFLMLSLGTND